MKRRARRKAPARTERVGMGKLISLRVEFPDGKRRTWLFREQPILSFDRVTDDASGRGRQSRLFVDCGNYTVHPDGRLTTGKARRVKRLPTSALEKRRVVEYRRTHGGLDPPNGGYVCAIPTSGRKRFVGWIVQMDYRANKKKHGRVQYFHPLEPHAQPEVYVNEAGNHISFKGGQYTVTPHGIEDIDR